MIKIIYPEKKPSIKSEANKELIFCVIRKRWILITPEEWVRQNFLQYLIEVLHYPASLIAVEKQLLLGDVKKRFDIVVYDKETKPFMIIECKQMNMPLSENALQQVLRYNTNIQAKFLIITNGSHCFGFEKLNDRFGEINTMPVFK
ncbi:MAG: type I restriction enzyme HsdR N-terminal domain-containing protein [Ferruginibacter sp.]